MDYCQTNDISDLKEMILEQTTLLTEASTVLSGFLSNVSGFLSELTKLGEKTSVKNEENKKDYEETVKLTRKLLNYIEKVHFEIPALAESMKESEAESKLNQEQIKTLTSELEKSQNLLLQAKQKKISMDRETTVQSNYTAAMGSIMGTMLWKTSKTEDVISTFILEGMISDFVIMSNVTVNSFIHSYMEEPPPLESHEYKFVMSVLGTSINISAQKTGRDFLLADSNGLAFTNLILNFIGVVKMPTGGLLKRMCLIFLFNLSICKRGAILIQKSEKGIENILKCLASDNTSEIQSIVLSLMKSLLDEIPTFDFCQQIKNLTSLEDLQRLMEESDDDLKYLSTNFHKKIQELEEPMGF